MLPFYANFRKNPNLFIDTRSNQAAADAMVVVDNIKKLHEACRENIKRV